MLRLYLDEDAMDSDLVSALRARGVDVITVGEVQRYQETDEAQLRFASEQGRAIYSFNQKDYVALHTRFLASGLSHTGIIICRKDRFSIGEQMRRLIRLVNTLSSEEMKDHIEFLSAWGVESWKKEE